MKPEKVKVWTEHLLKYAEDLSEKLDGLAGVNVTALIASHRAVSSQLAEKDKTIEELQKALEWASRIIGSGLDQSAPLRYDPVAWILQYHTELKGDETK